MKTDHRATKTDRYVLKNNLVPRKLTKGGVAENKSATKSDQKLSRKQTEIFYNKRKNKVHQKLNSISL